MVAVSATPLQRCAAALVAAPVIAVDAVQGAVQVKVGNCPATAAPHVTVVGVAVNPVWQFAVQTPVVAASLVTALLASKPQFAFATALAVLVKGVHWLASAWQVKVC